MFFVTFINATNLTLAANLAMPTSLAETSGGEKKWNALWVETKIPYNVRFSDYLSASIPHTNAYGFETIKHTGRNVRHSLLLEIEVLYLDRTNGITLEIRTVYGARDM